MVVTKRLPAGEGLPLRQAPASVVAEVGTGWAVHDSPHLAVGKALDMAWKREQAPAFLMLFAASGSGLDDMLAKARSLLGPSVKIFGGTSDGHGVMTEKGFVRRPEGKNAVVVMAVDSSKITFGVGSGNYSRGRVQDVAARATRDAIESAGKNVREIPKAVLVTSTPGSEELALKGIASVVGKDTIIVGGSTGGPEFGVIGANEVYRQGISVAVLYTDLGVGTTFGGGFVRTEKHGVVTESKGREIIKIDGKPALDVYDSWLDCRLSATRANVGIDAVNRVLTLNPLCRLQGGHELFSHTSVDAGAIEKGVVRTGTEIAKGDIVYLARGTEEGLLDYIRGAAVRAKADGAIEKPAFGVGYVCAGVMGSMPSDMQEKIPGVIQQSIGGAPFIGQFAWGEQGLYRTLGQRHCNLQTGFLVVG